MKCGGGIKGKKTVINWDIPHFEMFPGDKIESPRFTSALLEGAWYLEIETNRGEARKMVISLHRYDEAGPKTVFVDFDIHVYNKHTLIDKTSRKTIQFGDCSKYCNRSNSFIVNFVMPTKGTLILKILCQLRPSQIKLEADPIHLKIDKNLSNDVGNLLYSNRYYDAILRVGHSDVKCHRAILYARIPKILKEENSTETFTRITMKDFSPDAVNDLLQFAYGAGTSETKNLAEFQNIAEVYGNEELKKQLSWKDNQNAETIFNCVGQSTIFKFPKSLFLDANHTRSASLIATDKPGVPICTFNCDVRPDENDVDHLYFQSELSPFDPYNKSRINCQIWIAHNNSTDFSFLCKFEHKTGSHPANETKKTVKTLDLQNKISDIVFDKDKIHFQVDIQICKGVKEHKTSSKRSRPINFFECEACDQLSSDLQALYHSQKYSDVTFISENETMFPAHRAIVAARSKEFQAILENEVTGCIKVSGFSDETLSRKLLWIYSGLQELK